MAIKVNGTTVINDSRALSNISSVDATTAAAIGAAGIGGGAPSYSSGPTSGNAVGDLYWDTSTEGLYVWRGAAWEPISSFTPPPGLNGVPSVSHSTYTANSITFYYITAGNAPFTIPVNPGGLLNVIMIGATGGGYNSSQRSSGGFGAARFMIPTNVSTLHGVVGSGGSSGGRGLPGGGVVSSSSYGGVLTGGGGYTGLFDSSSHTITTVLAVVGASGGSGNTGGDTGGAGGGFNLSGTAGAYGAGGGTLSGGGTPIASTFSHAQNNQGAGSFLQGGRSGASNYDDGSSGGGGYYGGAGGRPGGGFSGRSGGGGSGYLNLSRLANPNGSTLVHTSTGTTTSQPQDMAGDINNTYGWANANLILGQLPSTCGRGHSSGNNTGTGAAGAIIVW